MMVDDSEFRKRFLRAQQDAQEAQSGSSAEPRCSEESTVAPSELPDADTAQETSGQLTEPPQDLDSPPSPSARIESALARIAAATCGKAAGTTAATGPPDALRRLASRIRTRGSVDVVNEGLAAARTIAERSMQDANECAAEAMELAVEAAGDDLSDPTIGSSLRTYVRAPASAWERRSEAVIAELTDACVVATEIDPASAAAWKELIRDQRAELAALSERLDRSCSPDDEAYLRTRARGAARARLSAMSPEERERRGREAALRRLPPEQAAAARAAADRQTAAAEWQEAAKRITDRYPALRRVWVDGPTPILHALRAAGLGQTTTTTRDNPDGSVTRVSREHLPRLTALRETPRGLEIEVVPLQGQSLAEWERAVGALRLHLGIDTLGAEQRGRTVVLTTGDAAQHLPDIHQLEEPRPVDPDTWRSYLGVSPEGDAYIDWSGASGAVIGGEPDSGKSGSLLQILAGTASQMELHLVDGKGTYDLEPLRRVSRSFDDSADPDGPLLDTLTGLEELRTLRARAIYNATGIANFWAVPLAKRVELSLHPVMLVIDECQVFFDSSGESREVRQRQERITALVRHLVQKGRSAGMIVVLATQKTTAESIPTIIRDVCRIRIALRCATRPAATAVLGSVEEHADPSKIAPATRGRAVVRGSDGVHRPVQAAFVPEHNIADYLHDAVRVPNQRTVAEHLARG